MVVRPRYDFQLVGGLIVLIVLCWVVFPMTFWLGDMPIYVLLAFFAGGLMFCGRLFINLRYKVVLSDNNVKITRSLWTQSVDLSRFNAGKMIDIGHFRKYALLKLAGENGESASLNFYLVAGGRPEGWADTLLEMVECNNIEMSAEDIAWLLWMGVQK